MSVLTFILSVIILYQQLAEANVVFSKYNSIESWLVQNVHSDNPMFNVRNASLHYTSSKSKMDPDERESWALFTDLANISPTNRCNTQTIGILERNLRFVRSNDRSNSSEKTRTEKIIAEFVKDHSRKCQIVYSDEFDRINQTISADVTGVVDQLSSRLGRNALSLIRQNLGRPKSDPYRVYMLNEVMLAALDVMLMSSDPGDVDLLRKYHKNELEIDKNGVESLLTRMAEIIYRPCKSYVEQVSELFKLATFDAGHRKELLFGRGTFVTGWIGSEICQFVSSKTIDAFVRNLILFIDKYKLK